MAVRWRFLPSGKDINYECSRRKERMNERELRGGKERIM